MKKTPIILNMPNSLTIQVEPGTTLKQIVGRMQDQYPSPIVAGKVNNELKDLDYVFTEDAQVELLDLTTEEGMMIYRRSLTFVLIRAAKEVFPGSDVSIEHSLGKGLYCEFHNLPHPLTAEDVQAVEERMSLIISRNEPIVKREMPRDEAIALFANTGQKEKVKLLQYRNSPVLHVYQCGWLCDYFYSYMVPSTGYLTQFSLLYYPPGVVLRFPEKENPTTIPPYVERPKLFQIFRESEHWARILQVEDVASLNGIIESGRGPELVRVAEGLHEKKIAQIADMISSQPKVRVILIAGPSSSGKTTFAQRLSIQLRVNGLRPISISLDDYFVDREKTPKDEHGEYDFEALEALDVKLFNEHLLRLIAGEEVEIPVFNFYTGRREEKGIKLQIAADQPIIIEGIHGLNEKLTEAIPRENKFKIYVSALTQLSIDRHNRIPTTDTRIIRRIVRDSQFRGFDALTTLRKWPSVRRGEERNIFPFQEEADVMFNSALVYELAVLRPYAEPLLASIDRSVPEYAEAKRLAKFLSYFVPLGSEDIPQNSIVREFIGDSCFFRKK